MTLKNTDERRVIVISLISVFIFKADNFGVEVVFWICRYIVEVKPKVDGKGEY